MAGVPLSLATRQPNAKGPSNVQGWRAAHLGKALGSSGLRTAETFFFLHFSSPLACACPNSGSVRGTQNQSRLLLRQTALTVSRQARPRAIRLSGPPTKAARSSSLSSNSDGTHIAQLLSATARQAQKHQTDRSPIPLSFRTLRPPSGPPGASFVFGLPR